MKHRFQSLPFKCNLQRYRAGVHDSADELCNGMDSGSSGVSDQEYAARPTYHTHTKGGRGGGGGGGRGGKSSHLSKGGRGGGGSGGGSGGGKTGGGKLATGAAAEGAATEDTNTSEAEAAKGAPGGAPAGSFAARLRRPTTAASAPAKAGLYKPLTPPDP